MIKLSLTRLLSFNAGYVDTASFLALHGLFAAHVTGNFVTLGAAWVAEDHSGIWIKLAALPMFLIAVLLVKIIDQQFINKQKSSYTFLLKLKCLLLCFCAVFSVFFLPFAKHDTWAGFVLGMSLVTAMAIQNAIHRLHWKQETPTTVMTGSSTQFMLDIGDLFSEKSIQQKTKIKNHLISLFSTMSSFALGCAIAAIIYNFAIYWSFILPPILAILIYIYREDYKKL